LTWRQLIDHDAFKALDMVQQVSRRNGASLATTRCPIRIDGQIITSARGAPTIGSDNAQITHDFALR
jgi:crotonobetainyl-CoA:carnitine CoA-transferase CaiB-like acyl-CoA transferase